MTGSDFGRWVKTQRQKLGLTLEETGELTGISRSTLIRIEAGNIATTVGNVAALVEALGGRIVVEEVSYARPISTDPESGED